MTQVASIYVVKVQVDEAVASEYLVWLKRHIAEIVPLAGFVRGDLYTMDTEVPGTRVWVSHYHARDVSDIESYLKNLAPQFRADGMKRFGDNVRIERRILTLQS